MGTGLRGGQTDQMRQLASKFRSDASTLHGLVTSLNSDTVNSQPIWQGPAADRFRGEWSTFKATLDKLVAALEEAGAAVEKNAQNIDLATQ
jgi:WXG100 family type VII secretion target